MIEESIIYKLQHTVAVSAIVAKRFYPLKLKQGCTFPAISYQLITSNRIHDMSGPKGVAVKLLQITCWAESYSEIKTLASKVRIALDGFRGTINSETDIGGIALMGDHDDYDPDTGIYSEILEFSVPHGESLS